MALYRAAPAEDTNLVILQRRSDGRIYVVQDEEGIEVVVGASPAAVGSAGSGLRNISRFAKLPTHQGSPATVRRGNMRPHGAAIGFAETTGAYARTRGTPTGRTANSKASSALLEAVAFGIDPYRPHQQGQVVQSQREGPSEASPPDKGAAARAASRTVGSPIAVADRSVASRRARVEAVAQEQYTDYLRSVILHQQQTLQMARSRTADRLGDFGSPYEIPRVGGGFNGWENTDHGFTSPLNGLMNMSNSVGDYRHVRPVPLDGRFDASPPRIRSGLQQPIGIPDVPGSGVGSPGGPARPRARMPLPTGEEAIRGGFIPPGSNGQGASSFQSAVVALSAVANAMASSVTMLRDSVGKMVSVGGGGSAASSTADLLAAAVEQAEECAAAGCDDGVALLEQVASAVESDEQCVVCEENAVIQSILDDAEADDGESSSSSDADRDETDSVCVEEDPQPLLVRRGSEAGGPRTLPVEVPLRRRQPPAPVELSDAFSEESSGISSTTADTASENMSSSSNTSSASSDSSISDSKMREVSGPAASSYQSVVPEPVGVPRRDEDVADQSPYKIVQLTVDERKLLAREKLAQRSQRRQVPPVLNELDMPHRDAQQERSSSPVRIRGRFRGEPVRSMAQVLAEITRDDHDHQDDEPSFAQVEAAKVAAAKADFLERRNRSAEKRRLALQNLAKASSDNLAALEQTASHPDLDISALVAQRQQNSFNRLRWPRNRSSNSAVSLGSTENSEAPTVVVPARGIRRSRTRFQTPETSPAEQEAKVLARAQSLQHLRARSAERLARSQSNVEPSAERFEERLSRLQNTSLRTKLETLRRGDNTRAISPRVQALKKKLESSSHSPKILHPAPTPEPHSRSSKVEELKARISGGGAATRSLSPRLEAIKKRAHRKAASPEQRIADLKLKLSQSESFRSQSANAGGNDHDSGYESIGSQKVKRLLQKAGKVGRFSNGHSASRQGPLSPSSSVMSVTSETSPKSQRSKVEELKARISGGGAATRSLSPRLEAIKKRSHRKAASPEQRIADLKLKLSQGEQKYFRSSSAEQVARLKQKRSSATGSC